MQTMEQCNNEIIDSLCHKISQRDQTIKELYSALKLIYDHEPAGVSRDLYRSMKAALINAGMVS